MAGMSSGAKTGVVLAALIALITCATLAYDVLARKVPTPGLADGYQAAATSQAVEGDSRDKEARDKEGLVLAPDFTVIDENDDEVSLSDLFGKPIVLNFWASWCPPCRGEMLEFNLVYEDIGQDVRFMMIDLTDGQRETVALASEYVQKQGFSFPVYFDVNGDAAVTYGITSIPTTVFIDKDGYIVTGAMGAIDEELLRLGISMIMD